MADSLHCAGGWARTLSLYLVVTGCFASLPSEQCVQVIQTFINGSHTSGSMRDRAKLKNNYWTLLIFHLAPPC